MEIRKATENDVNKLIKIIINLKTELSQFKSKEEQKIMKETKTNDEIKENIKSLISKKHFLVACENTEIIGYVYGNIKELKHIIYKPIKYGTLNYLWVKKEFRKNKISSKLKNELLKWFKKNNCKYIDLLVLNENPAQNIYEKWGFKKYLIKMRKIIDNQNN
ncbi:MAG: GNAT family N-acetyltransferase [DPANN group archaeon]|nr:GNAT family N-acetyltransferase [DPANN group archaeon]